LFRFFFEAKTGTHFPKKKEKFCLYEGRESGLAGREKERREKGTIGDV
jgi:hypothetical protein